MVLSKDCNCAVRKSEAAKFFHFNPVLFCVWEVRRFTFLIVDLSFHGQGHLLHVQRQPPCSELDVWLPAFQLPMWRTAEKRYFPHVCLIRNPFPLFPLEFQASKVFEPTLAEIVHKTGFLDPEKCASKSSEKSSFSVVSCNLKVSFWLQRSTVRQIEHLKPWSARPSPSVAWSENEQKPYCFNAPRATRPGSVAGRGWLAVVGRHFWLRERWLFVRSFNVSKFGSLPARSLSFLRAAYVPPSLH